MALSALSLKHGTQRRKTKEKKKEAKQKQEGDKDGADGGETPTSRSAVNKRAMKRRIRVRGNLWQMVSAVLKEGMGTRECAVAGGLTLSLLARTWLSLWIAQNMGESIGHFCNQDFEKVANSIYSFGRNTVMAAIVNAALKYFTSLLGLLLRDTLTKRVHNLYMERMNYYKANHVGTDKFENTDQLICDDIEKFSAAFADVYSQSLKPCVDFLIFSAKLGQAMGAEGPLGMYVWFFCAVAISARVLPSYGRLAAEKQTLEGRFRSRHTKLIQNSEMVAFMRGEEPEKNLLERAFSLIKKHTGRTMKLKFMADTIQGYVNKYFASVVGFTLTARPVLTNRNGMGSWSPGKIASYYVSSRQVMEGLANAVLALFELQKRIGTLSGLSARVGALLSGLKARAPVLKSEVEHNVKTGRGPKRVGGSDVIRFSDVDIHKPDGVLLLKSLSISVEAGTRVMIT